MFTGENNFDISTYGKYCVYYIYPSIQIDEHAHTFSRLYPGDYEFGVYSLPGNFRAHALRYVDPPVSTSIMMIFGRFLYLISADSINSGTRTFQRILFTCDIKGKWAMSKASRSNIGLKALTAKYLEDK